MAAAASKGNDTRTRCREESASFSEGIVRCRYRSERQKPWFQSLPVRRVIPTMYRALYASTHLQPFQLVSLGKTLLRFLREHVDMANTTMTVVDWQHQDYIQMFDTIFSRLLTMEFDERDGFQELLDSVWDLHKNGIINFSETSIPEKLVQFCPERLEQVLQSCLTSSGSPSIDLSDGFPGPLVPLCERSPENFMKVMECLQLKLCQSTDSVIRQKICDFVLEFVGLLKSKLKTDYYYLYPSSFQPLLHFMSAILLENEMSSDKNLLANSFVIDEVLNLLDYLYYQCELMKLNISTVTFMLGTLPQVAYVLNKRKSCDMILYRRWPWLKRVMKTDEFTQSFVENAN